MLTLWHGHDIANDMLAEHAIHAEHARLALLHGVHDARVAVRVRVSARARLDLEHALRAIYHRHVHARAALLEAALRVELAEAVHKGGRELVGIGAASGRVLDENALGGGVRLVQVLLREHDVGE